jgi:signal transduction histidine kinase
VGARSGEEDGSVEGLGVLEEPVTPTAARTVVWISWAIAATSATAAVVFVAFVDPISLAESGFLLLASVAYATVGGMIAIRRPRNPIGWLFLAVGVCFGVTSFFGRFAGYDAGRLAGAAPAGVLAIALPAIVLPFALPTFLLLFPEGRLLSRRWRAAVVLAGLAGVVLTLGLLASSTMAGLVDTPGWVARIPGIGGFVIAGAVFTAAATVAGFASLAIRFRRAVADDRQQLKWLMTMLAAMIVTSALGLILSAAGPDVLWLLVALAILVNGFGILIGIPGSTAIAVLTYGLYDVGVVLKKTVVYGVLVATFTIGLGLILFLFSPLALGTGDSGNGNPVGRILSGLVIALLAFGATFRWLKTFARRAVYGRRATPYEVVAEFTGRLGDAYSTEDVLPRTAEILRASTGADVSRVWLLLGDELKVAASSPPGALDTVPRVLSDGGALPDLPGRTFPVRHQGELLGAFTVEMPRSEPLSSTSERLAADLATQAGLVLRNVRLTEELKATIVELRASRQRIVGAQDERARKLERDLHDGAQQQLVALAVRLRLAEHLTQADGRTKELLAEMHRDAEDALQNLRDLARGIYPPLLADKGLAAAIDAQARRAAIPVRFDADGVGRHAQEIEAAVYFCCLEALQNAAKYAQASVLTIRMAEHEGSLVFSVSDDGVGFDPATTSRGAGMTNMRDRLEALGGGLEIASEPGAGTSLLGTVPIDDDDRPRGAVTLSPNASPNLRITGDVPPDTSGR